MTILREVADIAHDAASVCGVVMQHKLQEQARDLRSGMMQLFLRLAFLKIGILLIAAGTGFLLWGLYMLMAASLSPAASALIIGGGILLIGLLLCWILKRTVH